MSWKSYDVIAFGAHPDDVEAVMGGTVAKLVEKGRSVLLVDLCDGEPARHARLGVARLIRMHKPSLVFTTLGSGVHPDHKAVIDIVVNGVFYARLPKWEEVPETESLEGTEAHEIKRLFFGHCRMEPPWPNFDFAVDVTGTYEKKLEALRAYEAVFSGDQATLLDKYMAEDRYIGSLAGVQYAEAFRARSPLLVSDPEVFSGSRFG